MKNVTLFQKISLSKFSPMISCLSVLLSISGSLSSFFEVSNDIFVVLIVLINKVAQEDAPAVFVDEDIQNEITKLDTLGIIGSFFRTVCTLKLICLQLVIFTDVGRLEQTFDVQIIPAFQSGKVLSVIHPPYLLARDSKLERELDQKAEEPLANLDDSVFSRSSSFSDLVSAVGLASANARIRRESHSQGLQGNCQALVPTLGNLTNRALDNLVLIPSEERRPSVIVSPSRSFRTSTPSLSPSNPNSRPTARADLSTIPICSRSHSQEANFSTNPDLHQDISFPSTMNDAEKEIRKSCNELKALMFMFNARKLYKSNLHLLDNKREKIEEKAVSIFVAIESLLFDYQTEISGQKKQEIEAFKAQIEAEVTSYQEALETKASQLNDVAGPGHDSSNDANNSLQQAIKAQNDLSVKQAAEKLEIEKKAAISKAKTKLIGLDADLSDLSKAINEISAGDWELETDISVARGMRKIEKWEKSYDKLVVAYREAQEIYNTHNLTENDVPFATAEVNMQLLSEELKEVKEAIVDEDNVRELYTLDAKKTDLVKLPVFSGKDGEDYLEFKEKMEKGLIHNRVTRADKLAKLREQLKGHALKLIPESLTGDIDQAWKTLDNMYGDPTRLVRYKQNLLFSLGEQPRPNGKGGIKAVVEWYLQVEANLQNLLELGQKDHLLAMEIWNGAALDKYIALFPETKRIKLRKCSGSQKAKLEAIVDLISGFRMDYQKDQVFYESKKPTVVGSAQFAFSGSSDDDDKAKAKITAKKKGR